MKRELQAQLRDLGVTGEYVHSEVFATAPGAAYRVEGRDGSEAGGSIRVADTGQEFDVSPQETLLAALERQGYRPSFSCRMGHVENASCAPRRPPTAGPGSWCWPSSSYVWPATR